MANFYNYVRRIGVLVKDGDCIHSGLAHTTLSLDESISAHTGDGDSLVLD